MPGPTVTVEFRTVGLDKSRQEASKFVRVLKEVVTANDLLRQSTGKTRLSQVSNKDAAAFTRQARAINSATQQLANLRQQAEGLRANPQIVARLTASFNAFERAMRKGALTSAQFAAAQDRWKASVGNANRQLRAQQGVLGLLRGNLQGLVGSIDNFARSVRLAEGPLGGAAARLQTFAAVAKSGGLAIAGMVAAIAGLVGGIGLLLPRVIRAGIEMENVRAQFEFLAGSVSIGIQKFDQLRAKAESMAVSFKTVAPEFIRLQSAAQGTNISAEATERLFVAVSKAAAVLRLSAEQTGGVFRAFQQIISKGTLQSEELRLQLGDRLPGAFNLAAQAMGVTTQQLSDMLKQGEVLADDFIPRFTRVLEERFGAGFERALDTTQASINRMENAFTRLFDTLGQTGIMEVFREALDQLAVSADAVARGIKNVNKEADFARLAEIAEELAKPPREFLQGPRGRVPVGGPSAGQRVALARESLEIRERLGLLGARPSLPSQRFEPPQPRPVPTDLLEDTVFEIQDHIKSLRQQRAALDLTEREAFAYNEVLRSGAPLQSEFANEVRAAALALFDEEKRLERLEDRTKESTRLAVEETKNRLAASKAAKEMIKAERDLFKGLQLETDSLSRLLEARRQGIREHEIMTEVIKGEAEVREIFGSVLDEDTEKIRKFAEAHVDARRAFEEFERGEKLVVDSLQSFGDSFTDTLFDFEEGSKRFVELGRQMVNELLKAFIRLTAINPLLNALTGQTGGGGLPTLATVATGLVGLFGGPSGPGPGAGPLVRQHGGSLSRSNIVGEAGPEHLVRFGRSTGGLSVIPNERAFREGRGGDKIFIDATGADAAAVERLEVVLSEINASIERRAINAVARERGRDTKTFTRRGLVQ